MPSRSWAALLFNVIHLIDTRLQAEVQKAAGAIQKLGGRLCGIELVDSHGAHGQRTAVVVDKVCNVAGGAKGLGFVV